MELGEAIDLLQKNHLKRIDGDYKGHKMSVYALEYKKVTIYRIDIHFTKQKTLPNLK